MMGDDMPVLAEPVDGEGSRVAVRSDGESVTISLDRRTANYLAVRLHGAAPGQVALVHLRDALDVVAVGTPRPYRRGPAESE